MLWERDDIVALDSAIIQHPRTWEASGHLAGFTDPLVDCRKCGQRFRADHLDQLACPREAVQAPGRGRAVLADGVAGLQPDVRDNGRPGQGLRRDRLPPAGDSPGDLRQLQERPPVRPQEAAVRDRPGRQVVSQRDHAWQLHLPDAGVRADGDGVLRPARGRRRLVRALAGRAQALVPGARDPAGPPPPAGARPRRALALLVGDERHRVPLPVDRLAGLRRRPVVRARGDRQPGRLRPDRAQRSTPARSSSTSISRPDAATPPT